MGLKDKVAIVTGSNMGFGEAIARQLAHEGAKVVVTYFSADENGKCLAEKVAHEIGSELILGVDVRKRSSVHAMMTSVADRYGHINILVNNAGVNYVGDFDKVTDDHWNLILDTDLKGVFICCQEVIPHMPPGGRVINIGSVSGQYGGPRTPSYAAAKAGVMALTHCFARFVGDKEITVNCVSPGMIASDMLEATMPQKLHDSLFPMVLLGRKGTKEEVAETVTFLASKGAGYITAQTIGINGGLWV